VANLTNDVNRKRKSGRKWRPGRMVRRSAALLFIGGREEKEADVAQGETEA
jgi:hypothetical protein